jgi:hypothetical protein
MYSPVTVACEQGNELLGSIIKGGNSYWTGKAVIRFSKGQRNANH